MRAREKKGVFQIKVLKRIRFLSYEYIKCITSFLGMFITLFIHLHSTGYHAESVTEDTALWYVFTTF